MPVAINDWHLLSQIAQGCRLSDFNQAHGIPGSAVGWLWGQAQGVFDIGILFFSHDEPGF
jgi:hypothetical protein